MTVEHLILKNLVSNEQFFRSALVFMKPEYFSAKTDKILFNRIRNYSNLYNNRPTIEALNVELSDTPNIRPEDLKVMIEALNSFKEQDEESTNIKWLMDQAEKFCKEKALHNAMIESIHIMDGKAKGKDKGAIPEILKDALAISFDPSVGHDFIDDYEQRYDISHRKEERIPFDIDILNQATGGGLPKKTLTVYVAGPNVGKSLVMCHNAASMLLQNKNVLYITLEMSEEKIAERIDANILDITLDTLRDIPKSQYTKLFRKQKDRIKGKLIIKEYPTAAANVNHFRRLLTELALKKKFIPDIIFIDYLNICSSSRIKNNGMVNTYVLVKSIAEEVRGLAVEQNLPIVTATQLNREGSKSSDVDMTHISESYGVAFTCDLSVAIVSNEELVQLGQLLLIQIKNRLNDVNRFRKFFVGVDRTKMRIYNVVNATDQPLADGGEDSAPWEEEDILDRTPTSTERFKGMNY